MNEYYKAQLEDGQRFQDHVMEVFFNVLKLPLMNYTSREMQMHAENMQGVEIKYDKKFRTTGNLYIEIAEKYSSTNEYYVPSGIYKDSNDWLFTIGDYETLYVFARSLLQNWHKMDRFPVVATPTSKGFLLPIKLAKKWAAKVIETITERT